MTQKSIYDLALHETLSIKEEKAFARIVMRVAGGFVYETAIYQVGMTSVFVPYHEEFLPKEECKHERISITSDCINQNYNDRGATRRNDALHKMD